MGRIIPPWIGKVQAPSNRNTTINLIKCWADLIEETPVIAPMIKGLGGHLTEDEFLVSAQEITRHLLNRMDEMNMKEVNTTLIWIGRHPKDDLIGIVNGRIAQILHRFFDHPDIKIGGSHPPIEQPNPQ